MRGLQGGGTLRPETEIGRGDLGAKFSTKTLTVRILDLVSGRWKSWW